MSLLDDIINTKIVSGLLDRRRPLVDANPLQGFYDSAPAGSVMAPGGLLANPMSTPVGSTPGATQDMLGLLSFAPIVGDAAGLAADAQMYANQPETRTMGNYALTALGALPFVPAMAGATVFHGSPYKFDAFDMSKIGTGEGAQAYGHGLYFAENPGVARSYRDALSGGRRGSDAPRFNAVGKPLKYTPPDVAHDIAEGGIEALKKRESYVDESIDFIRKNEPDNPSLEYFLGEKDELTKLRESGDLSVLTGNFYTVDLPDDQIDKMLDWDAPLSEQPEGVREAIEAWAKGQDRTTQIHLLDSSGRIEGDAAGRYVLDVMASGRETGSAEKELKSMGIPGIKYFDGDSRAAGEGTRNYVVFDDQLPRILRRE